MQNRPGSLNSKGEFGGNTIPRLVVEENQFEKKKHDIEEQKLKDEEDKRFQEFVRRKCKMEERNRKRSLPSWIEEENVTIQPPIKKPRAVMESEQILSDGDVSTRKERQILGGKRGRGTTVMQVHEIADLFKTMPKTFGKRKQIHENSVVESPSKKPRTKYLESNQLKQNIVQIFEDSNLVGISAAESNQDPQHVESESEAQD